jgi:hypothetical protein
MIGDTLDLLLMLKVNRRIPPVSQGSNARFNLGKLLFIESKYLLTFARSFRYILRF